ncbi:Neutral ceramidase [Homalodisca vitripennis]|nr:Neutral ceramidase [Homalodisca vitripennis]
MGYSFAAGTTDGPGTFPFSQNVVTANPLWDSIRNLIYGPSESQMACHYPKPIMLTTGEMTFPFEWQPSVVSTQLALVGDVALVCVPGEFTTMAGRRLRDALRQTLHFASNKNVLIIGLCNTYADYITTPEEYKVQRYEGASTIFGPYTLPLYLDIYRKLAQATLSPDGGRGQLHEEGQRTLYLIPIILEKGKSLCFSLSCQSGLWITSSLPSYVQESRLARNEPPVDFFNDLLSLTTPVVFDFAGWSAHFGQVLLEPPETVLSGDTVLARFVSHSLLV